MEGMLSTSTMVGDAYHATDFLMDRGNPYVGGSFSVVAKPLSHSLSCCPLNVR
jgi:hypothetical protein